MQCARTIFIKYFCPVFYVGKSIQNPAYVTVYVTFDLFHSLRSVISEQKPRLLDRIGDAKPVIFESEIKQNQRANDQNDRQHYRRNGSPNACNCRMHRQNPRPYGTRRNAQGGQNFHSQRGNANPFYKCTNQSKYPARERIQACSCTFENHRQ